MSGSLPKNKNRRVNNGILANEILYFKQ